MLKYPFPRGDLAPSARNLKDHADRLERTSGDSRSDIAPRVGGRRQVDSEGNQAKQIENGKEVQQEQNASEANQGSDFQDKKQRSRRAG